jgi:hypothetical protein
VANKYQRMDFDELADAPLEALGLASSDAAALKQALASAPSASWRTPAHPPRTGDREPRGSHQ